MDGTRLLELSFALPAATHKQDDRAFIFCRKNIESGKDEWQYSLYRPHDVPSTMVTDVDEAFDIVRKRNIIIGVIEE